MASSRVQRDWRQRRIDDYLAENGNPPPCGCGCGEPVGFDPSGLPRTYLANHQPKTGLPLGPKAAAGKKRKPPKTAEERQRQKEEWRDRRIAAYIEEHGSAPECACGCGEHVRFSDKGIPNKWVLGHSLRNRDQWKRVRPGGIKVEDRIPIDKFRKVLFDEKKKRGYSCRELADAAGVSEGHIKTLLYTKRTTHISRDLATYILRRFAGMPVEARANHARDRHASERRWRSLDSSHARGMEENDR